MNNMILSNTYILGDKGEGIVIDPGASHEEILDVVNNQKLKLKYIILTHAHIDHILSMDKLRELTGAKVLVHENDNSLLGDPYGNGSYLFGLNNVFANGDVLLKDGDVLTCGDIKLVIIHTPGHTPGSICIKAEKEKLAAGESEPCCNISPIIFTGDTLFKMTVGRTDLGKGDYDELMHSLKEKLMTLDDDIIVYPGHGTSTTIGYERKNNPFI